ncbi:Organic cation/carnitine transporter, partial [Thalictrum thalictroides]
MGSFGWNQFLQALLVSLAWVFDAQQTFISVFVAEAAPAWHCIDDHDQLCNSGTIQCQLPKAAWAWNQPAETCLVSEWNLECSGPFVSGLPASSFFFGCLMGGIVLATLADSSLGRKNMLLLSCQVMSLAGVLTVFSPNIWVYSALRFVTGFGRATIGTCALVLSTELVGKKWRGQVGILGFFCFTIGFLSLPAMAYLNKDSSWRTLYLWTSIPAIFYSTLVHFMVQESPRWLFVQGRKEEAINVLKSMSTSINFNFADDDALLMDKETWNVDLYSGLKLLWQKGWAFRRLSSVMIAGFGIGMVYY